MHSRSVETKSSDCVTGGPPAIHSRGIAGAGKPLPAFLSSRVARIGFLLFGLLGGCAVRAPHPDGMEPQVTLHERTVKRLISVWEEQLGQYITQEGSGDPAVLSQMRVLRSRDVLRPARITFDVLDVNAQVPSKDGWDVEGVLIGKHTTGARNWYVFLVGIVERNGYRPSSIEDIRLVGVSAQEGKLSWVMSPPDAAAVRRYWETFRGSPTVRFPGETDGFVMQVEDGRTWVHELRSGAEWSLEQSAENAAASGT